MPTCSARLAGRGRDAEAVGLLVVEDVDALDPLLLHELGDERTLVVVRGCDARVVARAGRVVLGRLARVTATREVDRQAGVRVRRRHHRDAALGRLVQKRDDDGGAARVERPDHADHRVVRGIGVPVLRALGRIPLRSLSGRVVARLEGDVVVAGLPTALLELELNRRDDLLGLRARRALEREVRCQDVVGVAFALVLERSRTRTTAAPSPRRPRRRRRRSLQRRAPAQRSAARVRRAHSSLQSTCPPHVDSPGSAPARAGVSRVSALQQWCANSNRALNDPGGTDVFPRGRPPRALHRVSRLASRRAKPASGPQWCLALDATIELRLAGVAELADARDSKSRVLQGRVGSTPTSGITQKACLCAERA